MKLTACKIHPAISQRLFAAVDMANSDQLLRHLSAVDQDYYHSQQSSSCHELPRFYWIFRNMDYEQWWSAKGSRALWLSGPAECENSDASSCIVGLAKETSADAQHSALYFFCSTLGRGDPFVVTFVSTIIHQLVCFFPQLKEQVTRVFLRTLVKAILSDGNPQQPNFKLGDSAGATVKKILQASSEGYWSALKAVMGLERKQGLFLVIDGLDRAGHEFTQGVQLLIESLQGCPSTIKVLLTSRPQADIKEILSGIPCVEYDKERKGLIALFLVFRHKCPLRIAECLNSLRFENTRYEKISEEFKGSLEWLWGHEEYLAWSSMDRSDLLLIEGKPGSGKSTLMKYFQRNLVKRKPLGAENPIVASFYYSHREGEQQTNHVNMLRSVLYDILVRNEQFFFHFQPHYRQGVQPGGGHQWTYKSLRKVLLSFSENHPVNEKIYLIVDAMDESDGGERSDVINLLHKLCATEGLCIVKALVASRPVSGLSGRPANTRKVIRLQDVNCSDILEFTESFLGSDIDLPPEDILQATEYIVQHAQGVFVWVDLVRKELLRFTEYGGTRNRIFEFLRSLPTELEELYKTILARLESGRTQDIEDGRRMLQFSLFAFRPLKLEEFRQALAIGDGIDAGFSRSEESFKGDLIHGIERRVTFCCGNLLEITGHHGASFPGKSIE